MKKILLLLSLLLATGPLPAALELASPFTDHMVLQRGQPVPVWGTADAGEKVTVSFAGQTVSAVADTSGNWRLSLDPLLANAEGRDFTVTASNPKSKIKSQKSLSDVLVGEVWLASGQSNMDFTVAKTEKYYFAGVINEAGEVAAADHPQIRMFTGDWIRSYEPQERVPGAWKVCTPGNVREFSAIGYFFARKLQQELNVPVGIVTLTYGASCAQAWIRREAIADDATLKPLLDKFDTEVAAYEPPSAEELTAWQAEVAAAKAAGKRGPRHPKPDPTQDQHNPTVMFNGMVAPFVGFPLSGVIWYQGESITAPRELFPRWNDLLITDWRALWGRESGVSGVEPLPFYFCQLAAHDGKGDIPQTRAWQTEALALPATGMAVTIDVGDRTDVHPHDKAPVGDRLARLALAHVYGRPVVYAGPGFRAMTVEGDAARLRFDHCAGGLVSSDGAALQTFEIAGADGEFVPAAAVIDGETLIVRAAGVSLPTAVRYAWSNYPEGCNLANGAGLPAAPFDTRHPFPPSH